MRKPPAPSAPLPRIITPQSQKGELLSPPVITLLLRDCNVDTVDLGLMTGLGLGQYSVTSVLIYLLLQTRMKKKQIEMVRFVNHCNVMYVSR